MGLDSRAVLPESVRRYNKYKIIKYIVWNPILSPFKSLEGSNTCKRIIQVIPDYFKIKCTIFNMKINICLKKQKCLLDFARKSESVDFNIKCMGIYYWL